MGRPPGSTNSSKSKKAATRGILDSYSSISAADKKKFANMADIYSIPEEKLLSIAVTALVSGIVPLKVSVELDLPKEEAPKKPKQKKEDAAKAEENKTDESKVEEKQDDKKADKK